VPIEWLADLLQLIYNTPNLDWLLLTKRPENWNRRLESVLDWIESQSGWGDDRTEWPKYELRNWLADWVVLRKAPSNVWIGTTVENQEMADQRIPKLLEIPAKVRFLSCEPLLGPVLFGPSGDCGNLLTGIQWVSERQFRNYDAHIDLVIGGGESGQDAHPIHLDWARRLRDQCKAAGVSFMFKQWGEWTADLSSYHGPKIEPKNVRYMWPDGRLERIGEGVDFTGSTTIYRIGKKAAGRLLDGVEHNEFPEVRR
jgi:protein gp37